MERYFYKKELIIIERQIGYFYTNKTFFSLFHLPLLNYISIEYK